MELFSGQDSISADDVILMSAEIDYSTTMMNNDNERGLDPTNSARRYTLDPVTDIQREVWRPGDGDGDRMSDYYDKPGPPPSLEKRWRFYQSPTGNGTVKFGLNEPPKYVLLDDCAAYEVLASDIPKAQRGKYWHHDFASNGKVRARRPHRGRPAIGDPDAEGNNKYHFTNVGHDNQYYYFTGQPNYTPIVYKNIKDKQSGGTTPSLKRKASPTLSELLGPNKHGHNQYTPKDQLVKYGAPSFAKNSDRYKSPAHFSLPAMQSTQRYATSAAFHQASQGKATSAHPAKEPNSREDESLWMGTDDSPPRKKHNQTIQYGQETATHSDDDLDMVSHTFSPANAHESTGSALPGLLKAYAQRQKLAKPDAFSNIPRKEAEAIEDSSAFDATAETAQAADTGSYAAQLEQQLAEARQTIDDQKIKINHLESTCNKAENRVKALEDEIIALRGYLEGAEQVGGDFGGEMEW